jgi:hypothetical protein
MRTIYFIRGRKTGLIKIGVAFNPIQRLETLQTGSPDVLDLIAVIENPAIGLEAQLHTQFTSARRHGEWFECTPDLLAWLTSHAIVYSNPIRAKLPKSRTVDTNSWPEIHSPQN